MRWNGLNLKGGMVKIRHTTRQTTQENKGKQHEEKHKTMENGKTPIEISFLKNHHAVEIRVKDTRKNKRTPRQEARNDPEITHRRNLTGDFTNTRGEEAQKQMYRIHAFWTQGLESVDKSPY